MSAYICLSQSILRDRSVQVEKHSLRVVGKVLRV